MIAGATGSGKSYWLLAVIAQLLSLRQSGLVLLDMKGETAALLRSTLLPALVATLEPRAARRLLSRIAVIAPFDARSTPPLQVLARDTGLPIELQAGEVASSFGHTVGRDLGPLQSTVLKFALQLAIDVGLSFGDLPFLLSNETLLAGAVGRCRLPDVRDYFTARFRRERAGSVASLLSRIDHLLMHPSLKRMLSAPGMLRCDRLLTDAVTVVDMTGAPAGMAEVASFVGQILFRKLIRAVFSRQIDGRTPPVNIMADEFQAMLSPEIGADFERVLTRARSQKAFLWLLFQQAAQVEAVSPLLMRILKTNTNYQLMLRSGADDARALAHILPVAGNVPRERAGFPDPRNPTGTITEDEERRRLVEQVPSLPDRFGWFWNRRRPYPAILLRSPTMDIAMLERGAARLPREIRELIATGILAADERELDEAQRRRTELRACLAAPQSEAHPPGDLMPSGGPRASILTPPVEPDTDGGARKTHSDGGAGPNRRSQPRAPVRGRRRPNIG
jgi:hypothetical protein